MVLRCQLVTYCHWQRLESFNHFEYIKFRPQSHHILNLLAAKQQYHILTLMVSSNNHTTFWISWSQAKITPHFESVRVRQKPHLESPGVKQQSHHIFNLLGSRNNHTLFWICWSQAITTSYTESGIRQQSHHIGKEAGSNNVSHLHSNSNCLNNTWLCLGQQLEACDNTFRVFHVVWMSQNWVGCWFNKVNVRSVFT